jgi:hypothetical protein
MTTRLVVHHVAGRGFPACNHPALLLVLHDEAHRDAHSHPAKAREAGEMVSRNGIALAAAIEYLEANPSDHRPIRETEAWT